MALYKWLGCNAAALREVLGGEKNAFRDIAVFNSGASLVVAGKTESLEQGVRMAQQSIDEGKARAALDKLIAVSNDTSDSDDG